MATVKSIKQAKSKAKLPKISVKEYNELKQNYRPSFIDKINEWKQKTGGLSQEEYDDFSSSLTRNKESYTTGEALF